MPSPSLRWFATWCQHTGFTYDHVRKKASVRPLEEPGPRPGPIDSSDLLAAPIASAGRIPDIMASELEEVDVTLRTGLVEKHDYWPVYEPTWELLKSWYPVQGLEIKREYLPVGSNKALMEVDLYPLRFKVIEESSESNTIISVNQACTVRRLKERACSALGLSSNEYILMDYHGQSSPESLESRMAKQVQGLHLYDLQALLLRKRDEVPDEEKGPAPATQVSAPIPVVSHQVNMQSVPGGSGSFSSLGLVLTPRATGGRLSVSPGGGIPSSPLSRSFTQRPQWAEDQIVYAPGRRKGLAGLGNLGNTCFLNSAVQCLAHSWPLVETFLQGTYKVDLNKDNPLGLGGKLAMAFGALMTKLWQGGVGHVSPKGFRWALCQFAPYFGGYSQQDSQELLAFLLDGLHEDLNRIQDKPYEEEKDSGGRPDAEVAAESWAAHKRRNDSVIVDHFQGMYKSTLVCPECNNRSVKFDPFMYLSLPLPSARTRTLSIIMVHIDGSSPPQQFSVELSKNESIGGLYKALSTMSDVALDEMVVALWDTSGSKSSLTLLTDLKAHLSVIKEERSRGFTSLFNPPPPPEMLVFRYRSRNENPLHKSLKEGADKEEEGEEEGRQEGQRQQDAHIHRRLVQIFHKVSRSNDSLIPPLPLYLTTEEIGALTLEKTTSNTFQIKNDCAIRAAIQKALQPFAKRPSDVTPHSQLPFEDDMDTPVNVDADVEMAAAELSEPGTPVVMGSADPSPTISIEGDGGGGGGGDVAFGGESVEAALDIWSAQRTMEEDKEIAGEEDESFKLYFSDVDGRPYVTSSFYFKQQDPKLDGEGPLYLVAEWDAAATSQYDRSAYDHPEMHASALAAKAAKDTTTSSGQKTSSRVVALKDCLRTFCEPERLDANESWLCGKCKSHVQAHKKLDLWTLPEVLVIHLKRFQNSGSTFGHNRFTGDKLDTHVDFPLSGLNVSTFVDGKGVAPMDSIPTYELFGVSNHFGGLGGGHYTAYVQMPDDKKWYTFDDSHVREMSAGEVVSPAAYLLFYRRQGAPCKGLEDLLLVMNTEDESKGREGGPIVEGEEEEEEEEEGSCQIPREERSTDLCAYPLSSESLVTQYDNNSPTRAKGMILDDDLHAMDM